MYLKLKYALKRVKKRPKIKSYIGVVIFLMLILVMVSYLFIKAQPLIITLCDNKARSLAFTAANKVINNNLENLTYENLVNLDKDDRGYVKALKINVMEMNRISATISKEIQLLLDETEEAHINVKMGSFFNQNMFSAFGPTFKIKIIPSGGVNTEFKTEFVTAGINQTRHRVYLKVKTRARVITPFLTKVVEVDNNIDVAETIIVGDVPETYYNLEGVKDLEVKDSTNLM